MESRAQASPQRQHSMTSDTTAAAPSNMPAEAKEEKQATPAFKPTSKSSTPAAGGPPAGGAGRPKKFSHGFFDPEIAHLRGIVFKILGGAMVLITLVMWICLPVYWGSLWKSSSYTNKLKVLVLDYDTPTSTLPNPLGSALMASTLQNAGGIVDDPATGHKTPKGTLGWINATAQYPGAEGLQSALDYLLDENCWGVLTINPGATNTLLSSRQSGNATYVPTSAVTFYYTQGRNELATGNYLVPISQKLLTTVMAQWNSQSVGAYLNSIAGNATALTALVAAPQTVAVGASFTMDNLRPYTAPVATAVTLVGLIYLLIFAFVVTMNWHAAREIIAPFLSTKTLLIARIVVPVTLYFYLSLVFSMINLPFKVPFNAKFSYGVGWLIWWMFLWAGMAAVGFATEFFITILGPKVSMPHELQPWFYRYQPAAPFYQLNKAIRTILFDTKNTLGEAMGILLAWIAFSVFTVILATFLFRQGDLKKHRKDTEQGEEEGPNMNAEEEQ